MNYYLVPEEGNPSKLVKVGASGFVPANGILIPDELKDEREELLVVHEISGEGDEAIQVVEIDQEAKDEILTFENNKKEQQRILLESLAYLESTDWYIIREMDTGIPTPSEVKIQRQLAREKIP